ncbi:LOW QUALITY PROTEIN: hypothetical protein NC652_020190 [Populus alba x Populus x berolinensis]|nr:LOW QUALITY PROTEIN: hypothetical protein NC652_020190 [Populus alba x Populus x berolinensis]
MAGRIQTMILTPRPTQTPSFRPAAKFPATRTAAYSTRSVLFNGSRSISSPLRIRANQRPDQIDDNASGGAKTLGKSLLKFADNNFLSTSTYWWMSGLANPTVGCLADKYYLSKFSTFAIFITSGLTLRNGEIGDAIEAWPVGVFGICSILLFTPFLSKIILQIQLQPQEFVTGLAIFCCMPTTLSSGVALTQLAGGNSALALAMTVVSNLLGILIVPFSISRFIAAGIGVSVPTKELFRSLVITLLIPLILGKVFRESFKGLADYVDRNRKLFSKMNAIFLSLAPFIQVSRSRSMLLMVKPSVFLVAVGMGVYVFRPYFSFPFVQYFCISSSYLLMLSRYKASQTVSGTNQLASAKKKNATAYVLVASQKTLPVMVAVVEQLGGAFGESGLLVLPCVAAHLNQIIMDSFLVNFWLRKDLASKSAKEITAALFFGLAIWAYQATNPPPPKICGTPGGPPITAPRVKLRDGRHLAYKEQGVSRETAKSKIVYVHGFASTRHDTVSVANLSPEVVQELGLYFVSFDRPGYGESDPDPNRSPESIALDIEELADHLGLGSKFHVMGFSMGGQVVWGCLKYIPHRLAGATLIAPVVNYWWPGFPANLSTEAYYQQPPQDQWTLRVAHHAPWLTYWWNTQKWFPASAVAAQKPEVFSRQDLETAFHGYRRRKGQQATSNNASTNNSARRI